MNAALLAGSRADCRAVQLRDPPMLDALDQRLLQRCRRTDLELPKLAPLSSESLRRWAAVTVPLDPAEAPQALSHLRHPQSAPLAAACDSIGGRWGRSEIEQRHLPQAIQVLDAVLRDGKSLATELCDLASACLQQSVSIRNCQAATTADRRGHMLAFPHPNRLGGLLAHLQRGLLALETAPAVLQAAVLYQQLICIHPFPDGNGRICRLLANAQLHRVGGMPMLSYLPLYELFALSLGGMEVRSRIVELDGDWHPWIAWFADLVEVARIAAEDMSAESAGTWNPTGSPPLAGTAGSGGTQSSCASPGSLSHYPVAL